MRETLNRQNGVVLLIEVLHSDSALSGDKARSRHSQIREIPFIPFKIRDHFCLFPRNPPCIPTGITMALVWLNHGSTMGGLWLDLTKNMLLTE